MGQPPDAFAVDQVQRRDGRMAASLMNAILHFFQPAGGAGGQDDMGAGGRQRFRRGGADAEARSGEEGELTGKRFSRHEYPSWGKEATSKRPQGVGPSEIGRAHVRTPVNNAKLECGLMLE